MLLAAGSTGFLISLFEEAAAAIGAGIIVGCFAGATGGFAFGWSRKQVEGNALRDGYIGALFAVGVWLLDACNVYAT
jgi:hypothetical protein